MKTPDEIKNGLELCAKDSCFGEHENCPYTGDPGTCVGKMCTDALAYIQQLERELATAVEWMKHSNCCCHFCKHDRPLMGCATKPILDRSCFEWRAAKEENE